MKFFNILKEANNVLLCFIIIVAIYYIINVPFYVAYIFKNRNGLSQLELESKIVNKNEIGQSETKRCHNFVLDSWDLYRQLSVRSVKVGRSGVLGACRGRHALLHEGGVVSESALSQQWGLWWLSMIPHFLKVGGFC